ncbi:MAG: TonB-dependent receptor plug domain-containing protein [Bacteroidales bacterium]|nr:TonB-dependent receptor plug domain-containing protein [Bacteroidales bacterium]
MIIFLRTTIAVVILIFTATLSLWSQGVTLHGFVREKGTDESLPGATIALADRTRGVVSNEYGYFSLMLAKGEVDIQVSFVGYQPALYTLKMVSDSLVIFHLEPTSIEEVRIVSRRVDISANDPNMTTLSMKQVKKIPHLLGEHDIMKALALTAGVNTGTDGSSSIHVRGGTPDQNLVLLDGATVYNNNHLFGLFSVFNPEAIQSVEIIKNGYPARFGGRLSSVVNVSMKEGNREHIKSNLSISPLTSQFTIDGPVVKDKSSFMFSSRAAYLSVIGLPAMYLYTYPNSGVDSYFNYIMYDVNAKFNHSFSENSKLFVSLYAGDDLFYRKERLAEKESKTDFGWGNKTGSIRYISSSSPRIFSESMMSVNTFKFGQGYNTKSLSNEETTPSPKSLLISSSVFDVTLRQRVEYTLNSKHRLTGGAELQRQSLRPDQYNLSQNVLPSGYPPKRNTEYLFYATSIYLEDFFTNRYFTLRAGIRGSVFYVGDTRYHSIEPRVNLEILLGKYTGINLAYSKTKQPLHLLSRPSQTLPVDVWVPVTSLIPPQEANQYSVGYTLRAKSAPYKLSLASYFKPTKKIIDYQVGLDYTANLTNTWEEIIETDGIGKAYGIELMIEKTEGRLNGWIAYTLARNKRKFSGINNGEWFNARYDRLHDLNIVASYNITDRWKVSSVFTINSGLVTTIPTAYILDVYGDEIPVFTRRNNYRMPLYHRLDIAFTKEYISKKGRKSSISFGAYNAYANSNAQYMELTKHNQYEGNREYLGFRNAYSTGTIFGFIPFFSYNIQF